MFYIPFLSDITPARNLKRVKSIFVNVSGCLKALITQRLLAQSVTLGMGEWWAD